MSFSCEGPDETGKLMLQGELTIQHVASLKEVLLAALHKVKDLSIALEGVTDIDLSCLQVLCSAHRTAIAAQKSISVTGTWPEGFRSVVGRAGYSGGRGCGFSASAPCLWRQENADEQDHHGGR